MRCAAELGLAADGAPGCLSCAGAPRAPRMKPKAFDRQLRRKKRTMKTMNRESMDKVVSDHFMYEAVGDIEGVMRTFTDDAVHEVVGGPFGPLRGKPAIRGSSPDPAVEQP